jgi:hypothetical protein
MSAGERRGSHANADWKLPTTESGALTDWQMVEIAVLMDIRAELRALNEKLSCFRVRRALDDLNRIDRRIAKHMPLKKGRP